MRGTNLEDERMQLLAQETSRWRPAGGADRRTEGEVVVRGGWRWWSKGTRGRSRASLS